MLLAAGVGFLGRLLLGVPAACWRGRCGCSVAAGLLASTGLAANRWRTAAIATPVVLIAMLAGHAGARAAQRPARHGADDGRAGHGGPRRRRPRRRRRCPPGPPRGSRRSTASAAWPRSCPTEVYGLDHGLGEESPWRAAGLGAAGARTLDLGVVAGDLRDVRGDAIGVSRVVAHDGGLAVGDAISVRLADTTPRTLRVAAIYDRAAGLGDVVLDAAVAGGTPSSRRPRPCSSRAPPPGRSLAAYAAGRGDVAVADRAGYLDTVHAANQEDAWGVWLIIALTALFAALALVNATAMATGERGGELATIRLLGGTPAQVVRMLALEMAATLGVALAAGAAVVWVAVAGVPRGLTGIPLALPGGLAGAARGRRRARSGWRRRWSGRGSRCAPRRWRRCGCASRPSPPDRRAAAAQSAAARRSASTTATVAGRARSLARTAANSARL